MPVLYDGPYPVDDNVKVQVDDTGKPKVVTDVAATVASNPIPVAIIAALVIGAIFFFAD